MVVVLRLPKRGSRRALVASVGDLFDEAWKRFSPLRIFGLLRFLP